MPGARDGIKDVTEFPVHVNVLAKAYYIGGRVERGGEERRRVHDDLHAHGLRDNEDVAEDYRRVDEALIPPDRLERDLARKRGCPADLKKLMLSPNGAELCIFRW